MKHLIIFAICMGTIFSCVAMAGPNKDNPAKGAPTKETLDKLDQIEKLQESLTDLEHSADKLTRKKLSDCKKAFGADIFCACLSNNLPVIVEFPLYIQIAIKTKEELNYKAMSKEDKEIYAATIKARELCVNAKP